MGSPWPRSATSMQLTGIFAFFSFFSLTLCSQSNKTLMNEIRNRRGARPSPAFQPGNVVVPNPIMVELSDAFDKMKVPVAEQAGGSSSESDDAWSD